MSRQQNDAALPSDPTDSTAAADVQADHAPLWAGDAYSDGAVLVAQQAALDIDLHQVYASDMTIDASVDGNMLGYDGHVPLAVDTGMFSSIDATLDMLTASPDLFDIPAMDAGGGDAPAAT
jgi:hypothetical protein